jgi:hypothetical protein
MIAIGVKPIETARAFWQKMPNAPRRSNLSSNLLKRENVRAEPELLRKAVFCEKLAARKVAKLAIPTRLKAPPKGRDAKVTHESAEL